MANSEHLQLDVVTPTGSVMSTKVDSVQAPSVEGEFGELPNHLPLLAALKGTRQVGFAVIATTLVLVAVFVPITFMQGNTGRLFSEFAIALAGAVCLSSLVALTLSPMMCSRILKPRPLGSSSKQPRLTSLQEAVAKRYSRLLMKLMQYKWVAALVFLIILVSIPLFYSLIDKEYAPLEDRGAFFVIADGPEGASFDKSYEMLERMEEVLMPLYENGEATRVLLRLPASFSSTNEVNSVRGIVVLNHWSERNRSMQEIMQDVNRQLAALPGYRAFSVARRGLEAEPGSLWNSYWVEATMMNWPVGEIS